MKLVGAGLSKTGTRSLGQALELLGFKCLHHDQVRLNDVIDGSDPAPDFCRYDDIDAVLDIPTALFFDEILEAYPDCKCVLTIRDEDDWWRSVEAHFNRIFPVTSEADDPFLWHLRHRAYGSATAEERLYRERFRVHNARVQATVAPERLLVMNIVGGHGWDVLCPFLGLPEPEAPFPHLHQRGDMATLGAGSERLKAFGRRLKDRFAARAGKTRGAPHG